MDRRKLISALARDAAGEKIELLNYVDEEHGPQIEFYFPAAEQLVRFGQGLADAGYEVDYPAFSVTPVGQSYRVRINVDSL